MEVKLEFQDLEKVSLSPFPFDVKNLQKRCKFAGERDFPIQNSYMDHVQCLSHSRDQKYGKRQIPVEEFLNKEMRR